MRFYAGSIKNRIEPSKGESVEFLGEEGSTDFNKQERIDYARKLGGEPFVCTMERETNYTWNHTFRHDMSPPINRCWTWEAWEKKRPIPPEKCWHMENTFTRMSYDYGFGINDFWNAHIVYDERFSDWRWQMEQAYQIFKNKPHRFNAYTNFCKK